MWDHSWFRQLFELGLKDKGFHFISRNSGNDTIFDSLDGMLHGIVPPHLLLSLLSLHFYSENHAIFALWTRGLQNQFLDDMEVEMFTHHSEIAIEEDILMKCQDGVQGKDELWLDKTSASAEYFIAIVLFFGDAVIHWFWFELKHYHLPSYFPPWKLKHKHKSGLVCSTSSFTKVSFLGEVLIKLIALTMDHN